MIRNINKCINKFKITMIYSGQAKKKGGREKNSVEERERMK